MKKITNSEYIVSLSKLKNEIFKRYDQIKRENEINFLYFKAFEKEIKKINSLTISFNYYSYYKEYYYLHYLDTDFCIRKCDDYASKKVKKVKSNLDNTYDSLRTIKKYYVDKTKVNLSKLTTKFHFIVSKCDSTLNMYNPKNEIILKKAIYFYSYNMLDALEMCANSIEDYKEKEIKDFDKAFNIIKKQNQSTSINNNQYEEVLSSKDNISLEKGQLEHKIAYLENEVDSIMQTINKIQSSSLS